MQSPSGLTTIRDWWDIGVAVAVGLASAGFTYARVTTRVNGLGRRVKEIELESSKQDERMDIVEREQVRAAEDRARIHEDIGGARRAAEESKEASEQARAAIVGAVHDYQIAMVREMSALREVMGERMTAVETIVGLMNQPRTRRQQ